MGLPPEDFFCDLMNDSTNEKDINGTKERSLLLYAAMISLIVDVESAVIGFTH